MEPKDHVDFKDFNQRTNEPKRYRIAFKSPIANKILACSIPVVGLLVLFWPALRTIRIVGQKSVDKKPLPSDGPPPIAGVGLRATSFRCL